MMLHRMKVHRKRRLQEDVCEDDKAPLKSAMIKREEEIVDGTELRRDDSFNRKRRKVLFANVEVREMFITIGESSVPHDGGPPLGISPKMKRTTTRTLDSFEFERETGRRLKSSGGSPLPQRLGKDKFAREGRVPAEVRSIMLARAIPVTQVHAAAKTAQKIQQERDDTNRPLLRKSPFPYCEPEDGESASPSSLLLSMDNNPNLLVSSIVHDSPEGFDVDTLIKEELQRGKVFYGVADLFQ